MSRIGKLPIKLEKIQAVINPDNEVVVKGAKQSLKIKMKPQIKAKIEDGKIILERSDDSAQSKALHGLYRALLYNAVKGLSIGFTRDLVLNGVGYRAAVSGKKLELSLGFSHPVFYQIPEGIDITVDKNTNISIKGADKRLVGEVAAQIRAFRPPEPYLGKGIKYADETIRRKAGKAAGK